MGGKRETGFLFHKIQENNFRWIKDLRVKRKILQEIYVSPCLTLCRKDLLNATTKALTTTSKNHTFYYIQVKNFSLSNYKIKQVK